MVKEPVAIIFPDWPDVRIEVFEGEKLIRCYFNADKKVIMLDESSFISRSLVERLKKQGWKIETVLDILEIYEKNKCELPFNIGHNYFKGFTGGEKDL